MEYEAIIGLEVHAQLTTKSKIFCSCSTKFGAIPNNHTCVVDLGMPGILPVLNKKVIEFTLKMALATNCKINQQNIFARKNYFYPDLPKGYQISQYLNPIAENGYIFIELKNGTPKKIGITRIHMEEDAGKLIHDEANALSYIDFNRAGIPLIEIVSEPNLNTSEEAIAYLKHLHEILLYLDICDCNMEKGNFRCDANISIRPKGTKIFGIRTELKNMNSFKNIQHALEYEIKRQKYIIDSGDKLFQETRLWNDNIGITVSMRSKEKAHDYRYFPDPDLIPINLKKSWIDKIKNSLPELPLLKRKRFIKEYNLPVYDVNILTSNKYIADFYEETVKFTTNPKIVSNWIMGELLRLLNENKQDIKNSPVSANDLSELINFIEKGIINGKIAKSIFEEMFYTNKRAKDIINEKKLNQITDTQVIESIIDEIIKHNSENIKEYKAGKKKIFTFLVGQVMQKTKGKANPVIVNHILNNKLDKNN